MAPIGYRNDPITGKVVSDEEYAPWIRKAYSLYATGEYSLAALNEKLYSEGFRAKRSKKKPNKQSMKRILTNPFYIGRCFVKGIEYQLNHSPLVSKEIFDKVQSFLGTIVKPKMNTKNLPFSGLMKCGHCGRSITGEEKRKKNGHRYVYYHCTGVSGLCDSVTYLEQTKIERVFDEAIKAINVPENIIEITKQALIESHKKEKTFHDNAIRGLNLEYANIQNKIDACYEDKLAGNIDQQFWERKTGEWKRKQQDILDSLANHKNANSRFYVDGLELLELSKNAYQLYSSRALDEKRSMINLVLSNCQIKDGSVCFDYRKPFDLMVKEGEVKKWGDRWGSNPRQPEPQSGALPTELRSPLNRLTIYRETRPSSTKR
jgi:site-specific DNA recombinase